MSKFTPGPWIYLPHVDYGHRFVIAQPNDGFFVAETCGGLEPGEEEANARLIASAPDLLDACKAVLQALKGHEPCSDAIEGVWKPCPSCEATQRLYAAIAQAEGGEVQP